MIETMIKRDGREEPFSAAKANGWGEWGAKNLGSDVNWPEAVLFVCSTMPKKCTTIEFHNALISYCLSRSTWEWQRMAGKLYSALSVKEIYPSGKRPHLADLHQQMREDGLLEDMGYTAEEYDQINAMLNHKLDLKGVQYELQQLRTKYAIRNKITRKEYETPQFTYMRMAMALCQDDDPADKLIHVKNFYDEFSQKRLNPPTPNFTNLGTPHRGFASCCLYMADDSWQSLLAGDNIAYSMTCMSAGIGSMLKTRSKEDPIRGGLIPHQGKLPYLRAQAGMVGANLQNGRGGAATTHLSMFDPEFDMLVALKNPMTPTVRQLRALDYSFGSNRFLARAAAKGETLKCINYLRTPELFDAMYSADEEKFVRLYHEADAAGLLGAEFFARDRIAACLVEAEEVGRQYLHFTHQMNKHTPHNDTIWLSNLCQEICLPAKPYSSVEALYSSLAGDGEIALCNLAGIIVSNVNTDEQYAKTAYYALRMIDKTIHLSTYVFKSLEVSAKARMNAGVGILGLAHLMAKKHLKYDSQEGLNFAHELAETHAWHLYNASLQLGKERGNAPWIDKTKWPTGWLPLDTYEKNVDELVTTDNKRDWESLRSQIIANKGVRFSVCIAHMPGESSTIGAATTNGLYPIRDFDLVKTNDTGALYYVVPESTKLRKHYQMAWDIGGISMIKFYAVFQKWADQGISADIYRDNSGNTKTPLSLLLAEYFAMVKYGLKSRYYVNFKTGKALASKYDESAPVQTTADVQDDEGECESCKL